MLPKLKISSFLLERLRNVKQQCSGCLFGVIYDEGTLLLMNFNLESTIGKLNYEQIQHKFPAEIDLCGLVKFGDCTDAEAHLNDILKDVDITDNPILLHCPLGTLVGMRASIFMHGKLEEVHWEIVQPEQLYENFCFTRFRCSLKIFSELSKSSLKYEMSKLRKMLTNGSVVFEIEPSDLFITNNGTTGGKLNSNSYVYDIIRDMKQSLRGGNSKDQNSENAKSKSNKRRLAFMDNNMNCVIGSKYDIIEVNLLRCQTYEKPLSAVTLSMAEDDSALSFCIARDDNCVSIPLEVEAMAMLCKGTSVSRLYDVLIESICRALRLIEESILEFDELDNIGTGGNAVVSPYFVPRIHHFYPQGFGHFLSCSYIDGIDDDSVRMQEKRKPLHRHFGLPVSRPFFRRANQCIFLSDIDLDEGPLISPHLGLRPTDGLIDGGKQYLVQGNYLYYHYLQQNIQDKGWGCAYRSLQTVWSWFNFQGYTNKKVPHHLEIQRTLVELGDKPQSFIGSSQWIGSTEIGMCLENGLNICSRILHVGSGGELLSLVPDLVTHFETQGSPVMIGGGNLAHTIIGVSYAPTSDKCMFLILDPHFVGEDDLQLVLSKGWCGWKNVQFFDRKSYYNLCLPQRPHVF